MASDKTTVLIVEDEPAIVELVTYSLRESGWNCCSVQNVADAWEFIQHRTPHLILLDWMLPDQTGLRLLSRIRADRNFAAIPVIMLTAKSMEEDKLAGLNSGADDYVTKPFSPRELGARIKTVLRRAGGAEQERRERPKHVNGLRIDREKMQALYCGRRLELTRYEFKLLALLAEHPGRVYSRESLMTNVWDSDSPSLDRTVDAHIKSLRAKCREIDPDTDPILTHRGTGYALRDDL